MDNTTLIAFLEELTKGKVIQSYNESFEIHRNNSDIDVPFAVIRFYEDCDSHDETMVVKFGGKSLHFDLFDKNWLDCFNEFWNEQVAKMERITKIKLV